MITTLTDVKLTAIAEQVLSAQAFSDWEIKRKMSLKNWQKVLGFCLYSGLNPTARLEWLNAAIARQNRLDFVVLVPYHEAIKNLEFLDAAQQSIFFDAINKVRAIARATYYGCDPKD